MDDDDRDGGGDGDGTQYFPPHCLFFYPSSVYL
jgi:hypothetical protein